MTADESRLPLHRRPVAQLIGLGDRPPDRTTTLVLVLALVGLWLVTHRYNGIVNDAILYTAQGMRRLDPARLEGDLYFAYGSQDAYSVFSIVYAPLLAATSPGTAAMATLIAGQAAFMMAAVALVRALTPGTWWWSLVFVAISTGYYGGGFVFRFAEPFATARTLAEPLVLLALWCVLRRRIAAAAALLLIAVLLHPVMALPGVLVLFVHLVVGDRRWLWSVPVCAAAVVILAMLGVAPFATLFQAFDAAWLKAVQERSRHLFVLRWNIPALAKLATDIAIAFAALAFLARDARRVVATVVWVAAGGVMASLLAVDVAANVLFAALQPWRTHWLLAFFAAALLPFVAVAWWRTGPGGRGAAAVLVASACFGRDDAVYAALLVAAALVLYQAGRRRSHWFGERAAKVLVTVALAAAAVGMLWEVQSRLPLEYVREQPVDWMRYVQAFVWAGPLLFAAAFIRVCAQSCRVVAVPAALAIVVTGIAGWDERGAWARVVERGAHEVSAFAGSLKARGSVYWDEALTPAWLLLARPSWLSASQGAGVVFSRDTALTYASRLAATGGLREAIRNCLMFDAMRFGERRCAVPLALARGPCERTDAPAYIVLRIPVDGRRGRTWYPDAPVGWWHAEWHLYACTTLMARRTP